MAPKDDGVTRLQALERFGIDYLVVQGWETRGNLPFDPIGILIHHTASDDTRLSTIVDGVNQGGGVYVPGPLVQGYIEDRPANACWVVAGRRANHAGVGDPDVLDRMAADLPIQFPPGPDQAGTGANTKLEGVELEGNGPEDFIAGTYVYETAVKYAAAICWWYGWNPYTRCAGHKEWTRRKVDPAFNMDTFRAAVAATIEEVTDVAFLPVEPTSSKGDIALIQNMVNDLHGTAMTPDGVWDAELQSVLESTGVVDAARDQSIGGNEFWRELLRPLLQKYGSTGGDHPHPFAAEDHTHPLNGKTGEPT